MYLNFYHNLTFRWTKQKKIPSVTFSTKRIPKVTQESCPGCIFENKNTEQETSLKWKTNIFFMQGVKAFFSNESDYW